jgi:APA family basic amino acid/polyamine antiporter
MVVGIIIGASIFVQPSEINRHVPNLGGILAVWILAGLLTFSGALVCAELSSAFPRTGGVFVFLEEGVSRACGFLWGWAMFWTVHSGIIAASSVILARYVGFFVGLDDRAVRIVGIASILLLSWINYLGVRQGSLVQTIATSAKIFAIAILLAAAFALGVRARPPASTPHIDVTSGVSPVQFVLAISAALFTFGGWHMVTYAAGETRNPAKIIPKALWIGVAIVTLCYLALNSAYLYLLPVQKVISSTRVAADAANMVAGRRGAALVSGLVILSSVSVLNGVILAGPRMYLAMAEDGLLFRWAAAIHPRFHTPHIAIWMQALWSCFLVASSSYSALFTRVVYTEWLFFALMTAGLFRLRRSSAYTPAYRVWGYPAVPLLFILSSLVVVCCQVAADPWNASIGLLLVLVGLPVYYICVHANH